jgi:hypothetical protein
VAGTEQLEGSRPQDSRSADDEAVHA